MVVHTYTFAYPVILYEFVLAELDKVLSKPSGDSVQVKVLDILETICSQDNFRIYEFIPPKMERACQHLLSE